MTAYLVIIETQGDTVSAYVPDLPGCVAVGDSAEEVQSLMREAIPLHIDSMRRHGEVVPPPHTEAVFVEPV